MNATRKICKGLSAGLLLVWGVVTFAEEAGSLEGIGDPESERYEELEKGKSGFRETWVLPGADFSQFSKLYFWEGVFEYREVQGNPASSTYRSRSSKTEFPISDEGRMNFEEIVREEFSKEMIKGKQYEIVDQIGPDTLILRGGMLDIISRVPPETIGRTDTYLATIGEATFVVEFIHPASGDMLAMVSERRKIETGPGGGITRYTLPANSVTVRAEIKRWAANMASRLRRELDKAMK